jgi:hypothetical protein
VGSGAGVVYCHASCKRGRLKLVAAEIPGTAGLKALSVAATAEGPAAGSRAENGVRHKVRVSVMLCCCSNIWVCNNLWIVLARVHMRRAENAACVRPYATCSAHELVVAQPERSKETAATIRICDKPSSPLRMLASPVCNLLGVGAHLFARVPHQCCH